MTTAIVVRTTAVVTIIMLSMTTTVAIVRTMVTIVMTITTRVRFGHGWDDDKGCLWLVGFACCKHIAEQRSSVVIQ
jgi:hypothetical protein